MDCQNGCRFILCQFANVMMSFSLFKVYLRGCDVGAQDPYSHSCWRHIQRMGVQVDKLHQGLSAEVVCPEQWAVVILQVRFPVDRQIKSRKVMDLILSPEKFLSIDRL